VCKKINDHPHKSDIYPVLIEELKQCIHVCFTGQITHTINALNGFVDDIKIGISIREELSNKIVNIRHKQMEKHSSDMDAYIAETIPIVWQLLEDYCIPPIEHMAWLESV
jgi:hypothetical protein